MPDKLEVKGFLGFADEVVFLLYPVELALEHVDRIERGVSAHATLHGARLFPLLYNVVDLVLDNLVLGDNL